MRVVAAIACLLLAPFAPSPCAAGVVEDVVAVAGKYGAGPLAVRTLAIVSLAMFDAANAVEHRYQPYLAPAPPPPATDTDQAAIGAGCAALAALLPAQDAAIAKDCDAIRQEPNEAAAAGRRFGATVGRAHADARKGDGMGAPNAYRPYAAPGVYVPTTLPLGFDAATARPFALKSPAQFRADPPPALTSERWARDYNETKTMGRREGSQRSAEQTATALFFASAGAQQFLDSMATIPLANAGGTVDRARYFALVYMTLFDAGIALFDSKYTYNVWRPITAIRNGDLDGNDATARDATWLPLVDTPMHPEYPCAHCLTGAAFATIVMAFVGDGNALPLRSAAVPGQTPTVREFRSARDVGAMIGDARVYGGVHFRVSTETGSAMGIAVAEYVLATQLRPVGR